MHLTKKLILHSPVSDEALLGAFVERCLADGVSLLAIFGPGSDVLEEKIDWLVIGDGSRPDRFLCTTSHLDEPLDGVLAMVTAWEADGSDAVDQVRI
ncbi:hypothetical protein GOZ90_16325 [Agrobacterium vitis]|uniref:Uncharacterized protein n=1 Tax=Agrobacterium vitis TaxID=373 RepID=A0A6L6VHF2_AGRVI|nr:hypothetical protein [Agrobacterium vitis]MCF1466774.1 hypothetical protein [Agrobacterium vitis]MUZ74255.1 hypothetical protein [Agrobacterium vitis]MVA56077.1 hypothetical protein [Agrobacterium vitis]